MNSRSPFAQRPGEVAGAVQALTPAWEKGMGNEPLSCELRLVEIPAGQTRAADAELTGDPDGDQGAGYRRVCTELGVSDGAADRHPIRPWLDHPDLVARGERGRLCRSVPVQEAHSR